MDQRVRLDDIPTAIADISSGKPVIVVDDEDRENEGDIIFAAAKATPELMAFTVRHTSGVVCVGMTGAVLDLLEIPPMTEHNRDPMRTAYAVSVDAFAGVTTGISATDRAHTARLLAEPTATSADFRRPGHVFPLRYRDGGVLVRRGHTEAAVDLARAAGLAPAGVLAEVVNDDGTMKRAAQLRHFADIHGLSMISIDALAAHRRRTETTVERVATTRMPLSAGVFSAIGFRSLLDGVEHIALVHGSPAQESSPLTRVHSECLTGDAFGSRRCDCGSQLEVSLERIVAQESGVLVYLRGQEGRGIGLTPKLAAYALQDHGRDTVEANIELGFGVDLRDYTTAAHILRDLGVSSSTLMTNNPAKARGLTEAGVHVTSCVPIHVGATSENIAYLRAKRDRLGHTLPHLGGPQSADCRGAEKAAVIARHPCSAR
ncbi:UNVERIFIED_ORG: 3,4-dihydroxy 2-butanone 4-phosphate synthase/GTP cyclohydrolase II [Gordonia westfalica J30]